MGQKLKDYENVATDGILGFHLNFGRLPNLKK